MALTVQEIGQRAKRATNDVAHLSIAVRNNLLLEMAAALLEQQHAIIVANQEDLAEFATQLSEPMQHRLTLDEKLIRDISQSMAAVAKLPDPIAGPFDEWRTHVDLKIVKRIVPLGVVAMVYEARPNVTVDAAALTLKSGNAVILRGGKEAKRTNMVLAGIMRQVLQRNQLNPDIIQLLTDTSHETVHTLLHMRDYVDVLIPRGSAQFINFVVANATVPVIETGAGNTHIFVDESADQEEAIRIIHNAKTQKPSVCNAAEKLLIHENIANDFLPKIVDVLVAAGVEVRGDELSRTIDERIVVAGDKDWDTEYNDLIIAVHIVSSIEEAVTWINTHTTHHSETIISTNTENVVTFMNDVDAAVVYQNASSRFTDGFEFGFGAEIGISTQKLHARGPMGLSALTTIKYEVFGQGQIRE
ncbi:glutamate-5-semialdehyde dehydrogenase [Leuconostoc carnosum]|uniref:glutamate-5-semialdehyde dehydrogenase n=1 Tax=Leuconostoc carnosum TaxID=1252 RepID=UPI000D510D68|nr:glutamate-5-semialdehyde dehydrogenase [Leuconostoc carnosum]KAA8324821.1 glutamate-5-semialdehyde dehydrogenase [Leuconostoc carnosum]KAA8358757.1 glutamate-5-semialdehyde dehydrogenase [Leuconostoc carnosum]KAA8364927.1 glutamate-5-semialdehyde dehydrogenase [Leuconostoc carnosum]KAA8366469.1 glutamate-5-semialdehyde dehydrogenase [Leuconostoc carnosum]KAA8371852.1 glutamate-5-semialdehyde dehydrogenase [Leuconostoc carnosum]